MCAVPVLRSSDDLALVALPWALADHPSLQIGALKSYLSSHGFSVQAFHFHANTLQIVGVDAYKVAQSFNLGEKVSAAAADQEGREKKVLHLNSLYPGVDWQQAVERLDAAFSRWAKLLAGLDTPRIGFSVSLLQFIATMTVAQRVKQIAPDKEIIIGGAAILGELPAKILERYPQIDYIVQGEGEITLLEWLHARTVGNESTGIAGLWSRNGQSPSRRHAMPSLNELPAPNFDEYFQTYPPVPAARLTYEMARGCFYDKCTFCNLNEVWNTRQTRRKSAEKIVRELSDMIQRYKVDRVIFGDTNISDRKDFYELWKKSEYPRVELAGEVSAHLHRRDFLRMRLAGVTDIQIGIESFSPHVLGLMRKGVSVMRNVEMIRWCDELGIALFYNIMAGFPGERLEDLEETIRVMKIIQVFQWPRLAHYTVSIGSPLHEEFIAKGVPLRPQEGFVDYFGKELLPIAALLDPVVGLERLSREEMVCNWGEITSLVEDWKQSYQALEQRPGLVYRDNGAQLIIRRFVPTRAYHVLQEPARSIMLFIQRESRTFTKIQEKFPDLPSVTIRRVLNEGVALNLVFSEGEKYFFLPVLADPMERFALFRQEVEEMGIAPENSSSTLLPVQ